MTGTVLLIEDEDVLRRNLVSSLTRASIDVVDANSAAAARKHLAAREFALVCVDIQLGDGDGIDLIREIRARAPDMPVVVMTGQDCVSNRARAEQIDAGAFLAKPFALTRFRELVAMLLHSDAPEQPGGVGRSPSVLMYSHDTIGLGHMRRNSAIAGRIVERMPQASVLMLVGSPAGMVFDLPPGVDFVKLPSLAKVSRNVWRPGSLRISSGDTKELRAGLIERAVETFRPDVLLVDHEPVGVWEELVPALRALRTRPDRPRVILGLRDIIDDPARVRESWARSGTARHIGDFYDDVLVYGAQDVFASHEAYGLSGLVPGAVRYCGYVTNADARSPARGRIKASGPAIIVSGGGGRDAYPMMATALEALARLPGGMRRNALMITGPLMDTELRDQLMARAGAVGVPCVLSVSDLPDRLRDADFFITMGGYNAVIEALIHGCPTLVIPRVGPSSEQRIRAALFAARGYIETMSREEATVDALAARLRRVGPARVRARPPLDFNGAGNAASHIVRHLSARHTDSPVIDTEAAIHA